MAAHTLARPGIRILWLIPVMIAGIFILGAVSPSLAAAAPHFSVSPDDPPDQVWAREFSPSTGVTVSFDDPGNGVGWDYTQGATTDGAGDFDLSPGIDFSAGWLIQVSDGVLTKELTVASIWFEGVDDATDACWGYASPDTLVVVGFFDEDLMQYLRRDVMTNWAGYWYADFGTAVGGLPQDQAGDIKVTTVPTASEADADGDATQVNGHPLNPLISVFPEEDTLSGWGWPADADIDISVDDPATLEPVDYATSGHTDGGGNLWASAAGDYDIQPGFSVTATNGGAYNTQTSVTGLTLGGADPETDTVWGTAEPLTWLWVDASSGEHSYVQADATGTWELDTVTDLTPGTHLTVYQEDDDLDRTQINLYIRNPRFGADPTTERVNGWDWPAETGLFVTVDSVLAGTPVTNEWGDFDFAIDPGTDLVEGSVVTVSDGDDTKSTVITGITITGVDADEDTVWGTAAADSYVHVWVHGNPNFHRMVQAGPGGSWVADFTEPDGDEAAHDLVLGDNGDANQEDEDGDQTRTDWRLANPNFGADPGVEEVFGGDFAPWSTVTISIDDPGTVEPSDFETIADTDDWGNFGTGFQGEFDLLPGFEVTVSDGALTKSHTVVGLTIDGVNPDLDTVSGYGPANSWVWVTMWGDNANRHVETAGDGSWTADFSVAGDGEWTVDIVPGAQGEASWHDDDNDFTRAMWRVPSPSVGVDPATDEIWGGDFAGSGSVWLTVDDPGTAQVPDVETAVDIDAWGNFGIGIGDSFDIQPGHVVTANDGTIYREHVVTGLVVTNVDFDLDRVSGVAAPDGWVDVDVYGVASRHVQADGDGNWIADFSTGEEWEGTADIGLGTAGEARESDDDGDHTRAMWRVPNPHFGVNPERDELWGMDMAAWSTVTIEIDDPGTPQTPDYQTTAETDEWGNYGIGLMGEFDIQPGFHATVDDGSIFKEHTVTGLVVTNVDADLDQVSGVAAPDAWVDVDVYGVASRRVQVDGDGNWMADFANGEEWEGTADIGMGTEGEAREADGDWDYTHDSWRIANPSFGVDPERDEVWGGDFAAWSSVMVTIDDPGTADVPDFSTSLETDDWGNFGMWTSDVFDIQPGFFVTVDDGATFKDHTVTDLVVTDIDIDLDLVSGTAAPDSWVDVNVYGMAWRQVQADSGGNWTADFAVDDGSGTADIGLGTEGEALQFDDDTDHTRAMWRVPNPQVGVDPERDEVWGADMTAFSSVTITIDDPGTPAEPDYVTLLEADDWGNVGTWTGDAIDLQPGFYVTIDDGAIFKDHTVTGLVVTEIDPDMDRIYGMASPDAWVDVDVYGVASRHVQADGSGDWMADFSTGEEWEGTADIDLGTEGEAREHDDDWDYTRDWWRLMNPNFTVEWNTGSIWGGDFAAWSSVTITIDDPGTAEEPDYETTADTDDWGNFWTDTGGDFEIGVGHVVTVSDGTTTKTHEVLYVEVTEIDPDLDTVSGFADPFSYVWVSMNDSDVGKEAQADDTGFWIADFSTGEEWEIADLTPGSQGGAHRFDDGDCCTQWAWRLAFPRLTARPVDNNIAIWEFPALVDVRVTIDDPATPTDPDYDTLVETNEWGDAELWIDEVDFDLMAGHVVTAEYGTVIKEHTVTALTVTSVDAENDVISGTADDNTYVMLHNWSYEDEWAAEPAPGGDWSLDLMPIDPGNDGNAEQGDDDGDTTEVYWHALNPAITVSLSDGSAWGGDWPALTDITVTIDDPATPAAPDHTVVVTTDGRGWFNIEPDTFEMRSGFAVTATDGTVLKELTVVDLAVSSADKDTDIVAGTVSPDAEVWVDAWTDTDGQTRAVASAGGEWAIDFSEWAMGDTPPLDLVPGANGQAYVADDDGDQTQTYWNIPNPEFRASPCYEEVNGNDWAAEVALLITYDDPVTPASPDVTTSTVTDGRGEFVVPMAEEGVDICEGDIVTVSDGETVKSHVVTSLRVTDVDTEADIVSGTTSPDVWVWVYLDDDAYWGGGRYVQANGDGDWTADFSVGSMHGDAYDIVDGTTGGANEEDEDRDETWVCWSAGPPVFTVAPAEDAIWGAGWAFDALATVTIDDPDTVPSPDLTLDPIATDLYTGEFWVPDAGYDITVGDVITVDDGTTQKSHTVTALAVTTIDLSADTVEGTSDSADSVYVGRFSQGWMGEIEASWPGAGEWIADFSLMTDPVIDLNVGIAGGARQEDADGDNTWVDWSTAIPEAVDDSDTTAEDTPLSVGAPGVLDNDTYNEGQTQAEVTAQPAHGDAAINAATGAWTYTPDPNWNGTDSFTYILTEGGVDSEPATVTIAVTPVNDPPTAHADSGSVEQDRVLNVAAPGVLGNDSDIDGGTLTASLVAGVAHGDLILNPNGSYEYTPTPGWFGTDTFTYRAFDGTGYSNTVTVALTVTAAPTEVVEVPIEGDNRFETSVAISEQAFPEGADWVVIATGRNWPDALGGSALAGALDGPILLTDTSMIPGGVVDEIERLEATHAIILGGTSAVASSVETALNNMLGNDNVERIAGTTRYLTADAVGARTIDELGGAYDGTALIATGANYPDALAAAPLSAGLHWPLFLTKPTGITASTTTAMTGVSEVLVLGGTSAVPSLIETSLNATYGDVNVTRLAGADRYATAVVVATRGVDNGLAWDCLAIATGENFPDALAGGVLQGRDGSVMLLTKSVSLSSSVAAVLEANKATIHEVRYLGGTGAVSQAVRDSVASILE